MIDPEIPAVLEISAYTETGASLVPVMLMSPCDQMVVMIGPVQCRMGVGDGGPLTACPMPVRGNGAPRIHRSGHRWRHQLGPATRPSHPRFEFRNRGDIIPIDLGGRDPQQVLRSLFTQR